MFPNKYGNIFSAKTNERFPYACFQQAKYRFFDKRCARKGFLQKETQMKFSSPEGAFDRTNSTDD